MKKIFLIIVCSFFLFTLGNFVLAANQAGPELAAIKFSPSVPIPGFSAQEVNSGSIALYINAAYKYGAGVAGIVAMFMIVFASWQWIIASGNSGKIDNAKETITGALIGLALLLGGNLLLGQISSGLVKFENLDITPITANYTAKQCFTINQERLCNDNVSCQWTNNKCTAKPQCNISAVNINSFSDVTCCAKLDIDSGAYINKTYASVPAGFSCSSVCGNQLPTDIGLASCAS